MVQAIHVRDGQTVKAGEVLLELDPTINQAEREPPAGRSLAPRSSTPRG